ncbi:MAG: hypothetical protein JSV39_03425 [Candidatus Aenigmatarchaeota archaeon]|nr:MAG: hypothetical protein JSV39_03425 [Candidatus Aenigmarchaeota archaeon]
MSPKIQEVKMYVKKSKRKKKEYRKHIVILPKWVNQILGWEKGDELELRLSSDNIREGTIEMKRKNKVLKKFH